MRQEHLRTTFEQVPELYDRARPSYPPQIFDDLVALASFRRRRVSSRSDAAPARRRCHSPERGFAITCVELGERLAATARRKLAAFPSVSVIHADFETWQPEGARLRCGRGVQRVPLARADLRYTKTADLLREHGTLGFVSTAHVLPADGDPFFLDVQADYEAVIPEHPTTKAGRRRLLLASLAAAHPEALARSQRRGRGRRDRGERPVPQRSDARRYLWDVVYSADDYVAVLSTYSHHRALDDETRERLLERIHRRIEARPERSVRKTYLAMLYVAERV